MSANDFYLDLEDIAELNDADIIARADAQAWDAETEDWISIHKVEYQIEPKIGTYPVTFSTKAGTMVSAQMFVREANRIASKEYEEEIYAVNFFKKVDEIKESMALDTDLRAEVLTEFHRAAAQQLHGMHRLLHEGVQHRGLTAFCAHHEGVDRAVLLHKAEVGLVPVRLVLGEAVDLDPRCCPRRTRATGGCRRPLRC